MYRHKSTLEFLGYNNQLPFRRFKTLFCLNDDYHWIQSTNKVQMMVMQREKQLISLSILIKHIEKNKYFILKRITKQRNIIEVKSQCLVSKYLPTNPSKIALAKLNPTKPQDSYSNLRDERMTYSERNQGQIREKEYLKKFYEKSTLLGPNGKDDVLNKMLCS